MSRQDHLLIPGLFFIEILWFTEYWYQTQNRLLFKHQYILPIWIEKQY